MREDEGVLWDGTYEKEFYWLYPCPPGSPRVKCWPNAGLMNATDGSGREWKPEDRVRVELCAEDELFDEDEPPGSQKAWHPPKHKLDSSESHLPPARLKVELPPRIQRLVTLGGVERERELQRAWHPPKDAHRDIKPENVTLGTAPPSPTTPTLRDRRSARMSGALAALAMSGGAPTPEPENAIITLGDLHRDTQIRMQAKVIGLAQSWSRMNGKRGLCTHKFGFAGGFNECSACGVKRDKVCTHLFGLGGGFDRCSVCGDRRG